METLGSRKEKLKPYEVFLQLPKPQRVFLHYDHKAKQNKKEEKKDTHEVITCHATIGHVYNMKIFSKV